MAEAYRKDLADVDWLRLPGEPEEGRHAWQAFVAYVEPGKSPVPVIEIMDRLQAAGVASRPGTHAVPMLEYYRRCFGFEPEDFPAARDCAANSLALPLHNCMNEDDRSHIVAQLKAL